MVVLVVLVLLPSGDGVDREDGLGLGYGGEYNRWKWGFLFLS